MGINLRHEEREKAALSVGASGEWGGGVGLYGRPPSLSAPLTPDVSTDAGARGPHSPPDCVHKGPPRGAPPPSPLRNPGLAS